MYITSGFFSILLKQFDNIEVDVPGIFAAFKTDTKVLDSPRTKINAGILGRYLEQVVAKTGNHRIGLETGFILPFAMTGAVYNVWRKYTSPRELFASPFDFEHPIINDINIQSTKEEDDFFYFELSMNREFTETYPVAARQWIEMQYGIGLQLAFSLSGRYVYPVSAHSIYTREGVTDKLTEYLGCPVKFGQEKFALIFNKVVLDLPIIVVNKELLPVFEDYMNEIRLSEEQLNKWSDSVRRYIMHSLSASDLSLDHVAERFNMSKRNLHRKLKEECTSYQQILDNLRIELSRKYFKKKIPLTEIAFLLGFESQSAFNKFFRKHFQVTPNQFK